MPILLRWLLVGLLALLKKYGGTIVANVLLYLGLTYGVEKFAVQPMLDQIHAYVTNSVSGMLLVALGLLKFDICISMLLSAYAVKYGVQAARVFFHKRA